MGAADEEGAKRPELGYDIAPNQPQAGQVDVITSGRRKQSAAPDRYRVSHDPFHIHVAALQRHCTRIHAPQLHPDYVPHSVWAMPHPSP